MYSKDPVAFASNFHNCGHNKNNKCTLNGTLNLKDVLPPQRHPGSFFGKAHRKEWTQNIDWPDHFTLPFWNFLSHRTVTIRSISIVQCLHKETLWVPDENEMVAVLGSAASCCCWFKLPQFLTLQNNSLEIYGNGCSGSAGDFKYISSIVYFVAIYKTCLVLRQA